MPRGGHFAAMEQPEELAEEIRAFLAMRAGITRWKGVYREKFQRLLETRAPRVPITADELTDMIVSLIEGGLILARIEGDPRLVIRQSEHFRGYLKLLFEARRKEDGRKGN
jgi:TetR/AcrR family transcriptional repressor of nem operon